MHFDLASPLVASNSVRRLVTFHSSWTCIRAHAVRLCVSRFACEAARVGRQDGDEKGEAFGCEGATHRAGLEHFGSLERGRAEHLQSGGSVEPVRARGNDGERLAPTTRDGCSLTHTSPCTLFDPMLNVADCLRTLSDEADYHADHRSHGWLRRGTNLIAC